MASTVRCFGGEGNVFRANLFKPVSVALLLAFATTGCGTFLDFKVPQKPINAGNVQSLIDTADAYYGAYNVKQEDLVNARQLFELPIIGAAIVAVSALSFGRHPDAAVASGIVAGSAGALSAYYAPRQRTKVYLSGMQSMSCVKNAAGKVLFLDSITKTNVPTAVGGTTTQTGAKAFALTMEGISRDFGQIGDEAAASLGQVSARLTAANTSEVEQFRTTQFLVQRIRFSDAARSVAADVATAGGNALNTIENGIRQIHVAVASQLDAAVVAPSYSTILGDLRQAIQSSEQAKEKAKSVADTEAQQDTEAGSQAVSQGLSLLRYDLTTVAAASGPSPRVPTPDAATLTAPQSQAVLELDARVLECVALMNPN